MQPGIVILHVLDQAEELMQTTNQPSLHLAGLAEAHARAGQSLTTTRAAQTADADASSRTAVDGESSTIVIGWRVACGEAGGTIQLRVALLYALRNSVKT